MSNLGRTTALGRAPSAAVPAVLASVAAGVIAAHVLTDFARSGDRFALVSGIVLAACALTLLAVVVTIFNIPIETAQRRIRGEEPPNWRQAPKQRP